MVQLNRIFDTISLNCNLLSQEMASSQTNKSSNKKRQNPTTNCFSL